MSENDFSLNVLMNIEQIRRMQSDFDSLAKTLPGDGSVEFWFARDHREPLGQRAERDTKNRLTARYQLVTFPHASLPPP